VVTSATVDAAIEINLPRLVDAAKMQPNLRSAFNELLKNLEGHERGHERLARDAARRIDRVIRRVPPQPTCGQIVQKANALGEQILRALDQASRDYDLSEESRATGDLRFPTD
jgi:predicted secreted Zn-dependent protease